MIPARRRLEKEENQQIDNALLEPKDLTTTNVPINITNMSITEKMPKKRNTAEKSATEKMPKLSLRFDNVGHLPDFDTKDARKGYR